MPQSYKRYPSKSLGRNTDCNRQGLRMPQAKMAKFSGNSSDFHYKECTEVATTIVFRPTPTQQYFASYFKVSNFWFADPTIVVHQ